MELRECIYQCLIANSKAKWSVKALAKHLGTTIEQIQLQVDKLEVEQRVVQDGKEVVAI